MKKLLTVLILIMFFLTLCGCNSEYTAAVETNAPVPSTETTPKTAPTNTPTKTDKPEASQGVYDEATDKAEINQRIHDFINFEGEFSEEAMIETGRVFTDLAGNPIKFGIYDEQNKIAGWLFDSYEKNGENWILVGFDGNDGERFATLLKFKTKMFVDVGYGLATVELDGTQPNADEISSNNTVDSEYNTSDKITMLFESIQNSPVKIGLPPGRFPEGEEFTRESDLINELFIEVADNGIKAMEGWFPDSVTKGTKSIRIERIEEVDQILSDDIPRFVGIVYVG